MNALTLDLGALGVTEEALIKNVLGKLGMTKEQAVKALADKLGVAYPAAHTTRQPWGVLTLRSIAASAS